MAGFEAPGDTGKMGRKRFSEADVENMAALHAGGLSQRKIAKQYATYQPVISLLLKRRSSRLAAAASEIIPSEPDR